MAHEGPLADEFIQTRRALLTAAARDHLALCFAVKRFADEALDVRDYETACAERLGAHAVRELALPPDPRTSVQPLDESEEFHMRARRFVRRVAAQVTEPAVCRALARQLLSDVGASGPRGEPAGKDLLITRAIALQRRLGVPLPQSCALALDATTQTLRTRADPSLLGRALWRARHQRPPECDGDDRITLRLRGSPSPRLCIEGGAWVTVTAPDQTERSIRMDDLALVDQAAALARPSLTDEARERIALTVIESSTDDELLALPAAWIGSPAVASALLERLDDAAMARWMARHPLSEQPEVARRLATAAVALMRVGFVVDHLGRLDRNIALESLMSCPDDQSLPWAVCLGDADRVRTILRGVLGAIGQGLTADEALAVLWHQEQLAPLVQLRGNRCAQAFIDVLEPALRDGRLSADQAIALLGGGNSREWGGGLTAIFPRGFCDGTRRLLDRLGDLQRQGLLTTRHLMGMITGTSSQRQWPGGSFTKHTVCRGTASDISGWFAEILSLWRTNRISRQDATQLMTGLDDRGYSAWNAAFGRTSNDRFDPVAALAMVDAWATAMREGLQPPGALCDGLLSRVPGTGRGELAAAAAQLNREALSLLFHHLGQLRGAGMVSEGEFSSLLDATLDIDGLSQAVSLNHPDEHPEMQDRLCRFQALNQLTTFERLTNECVSAGFIDGGAAARLLMARSDGARSRSVAAAGFVGGDSFSQRHLLNDAVERGDLSPKQRGDALEAAHLLAAALEPPLNEHRRSAGRS